LPIGPSWDDVRRLLAMTDGDRKVDIRDRAVLMVLAIYGLRAGEVSRLRLEDLDWEGESLTVATSKTRRMRTYPLAKSVGDAILRYVREVRPRSVHREVFLGLLYPFQPLHPATLWSIVAKRLRTVDTSLPHHGPHALRHACARRLLSQGHSLKEIGDQLGHSDPEATRVYAKVDLAGLRQVAAVDLEGLL
jgi:integrase/recombinase XerD